MHSNMFKTKNFKVIDKIILQNNINRSFGVERLKVYPILRHYDIIKPQIKGTGL